MDSMDKEITLTKIEQEMVTRALQILEGYICDYSDTTVIRDTELAALVKLQNKLK